MIPSNSPILIIDDEGYALQTTRVLLASNGFRNVLACAGGTEALAALATLTPSAVLLDLAMPGLNGEDVLHAIHARQPELAVIIVTAANDVETAVRCLRAGAFDYIVKPVEEERLVTSLKRALEIRQLRRETEDLRRMVTGAAGLRHPEAFASIVTQSPLMKSVFAYADAIAATPHPVLITGETGTGKDLIARAIHKASGRSGRFVPLNVAGLDDAAVSDTLFGHAKGAFTGADQARRGLLDEADKGTLFLDEIGDLAPITQVKLLQFLQDYEYYPLGSDTLRRAGVRVIAATNIDPFAMQSGTRFRRDLYHRLSAHRIHLPPLRERPEDIPLLLDYFASVEGPKDAPPPISDAIREATAAYAFPGNVRELKNMVRNGVSVSNGRAPSLESFKTAMQQAGRVESTDVRSPILAGEPFPTLQVIQDRWIAEALKRTGGNQTAAAKLLGITRQGLNKRLNRKTEFDITPDE